MEYLLSGESGEQEQRRVISIYRVSCQTRGYPEENSELDWQIQTLVGRDEMELEDVLRVLMRSMMVKIEGLVIPS